MSDCEMSANCPFFNDKMANMPATATILKKKYCQGNFSTCARYLVCTALGRENVPADLTPSQADRAKQLLAPPEVTRQGATCVESMQSGITPRTRPPLFTVIVDIVVKREFVTRFRKTVIRQGDNSRRLEPGCLGFDILQDQNDPTRFTLYETYSDAATFHEVHRVTSHFLAYAEVTEPWVESKSIRAMTRIWP